MKLSPIDRLLYALVLLFPFVADALEWPQPKLRLWDRVY